MLILSLDFRRRADTTCFVSCSSALIFHSTEIKKTSQSSALSPVNQYITIYNILAITITLFKNRRSLGGIFPFILMGTFSAFALLLLQRMCSQRNCSPFKLFQPSYFSTVYFSAFQTFIFLPFQLLKKLGI